MCAGTSTVVNSAKNDGEQDEAAGRSGVDMEVCENIHVPGAGTAVDVVGVRETRRAEPVRMEVVALRDINEGEEVRSSPRVLTSPTTGHSHFSRR